MDSDDIKQNIELYYENLKRLDFYRRNKKLIKKILPIIIIFILVFYAVFLKSPTDFPTDKIIEIEEGASLEEIAQSLKEDKIIKNKSLFKFFTIISFNQKNLFSGDYLFHKKINSLRVLSRLSKGKFDVSPVVVTIPEGATIAEIGEILESKFGDFKKEEFLILSRGKEGFLFPDTYHFLPNIKPQEVIQKMESIFNQKIQPLLPEIIESGYSTKEIITMASLLEEEARTRETREIISGILWNRIKIGMPLQVDAVFPYIIGKNTFQLSLEDLDIDSPYNTYKYAGLPPGPISNPGLESIEATLRPINNDYLFYLSDSSGNMHYALDFEAHKINKRMYLR